MGMRKVNVHLLSPGVSSARVSGGGTPLFRAIAALLADHRHVLAYERAGIDTAWHHDHVTVRQWGEPQHAVDDILNSVRPGDIVIKVAGALPGRWDMIADIELAQIRSRSSGMRLVYVDVDGPSRLPILQYTGTYLDTTLPATDAVIVCAGGARAVHAYRMMTNAPIVHLTVAIVWYGVPTAPNFANRPRFDVAAVFGGDARRQQRVMDICTAFARAGLTVALAGPAVEEMSAGITSVGFIDGPALAEVVAGSRFSLSLLREDVSGFSDIHPCRIVEAGRLRSMIVSDVFPGMARLVAPGRELIPLDLDSDVLARTLRDFDEPTRLAVTKLAHDRIEAVASEEARTFIDAVFGRSPVGTLRTAPACSRPPTKGTAFLGPPGK